MGVAARGHPWRRRALLFNACCLALMPFAAVAGEATASLASVRVRYDDTRWRVSDRGEWLRFNPLGEIARDRDPVGLHVLNDAASCAELARAAFDGGRYDKQSLAASGGSIGGLTAERFAAHTGCRNGHPARRHHLREAWRSRLSAAGAERWLHRTQPFHQHRSAGRDRQWHPFRDQPEIAASRMRRRTWIPAFAGMT